MQVNVGKGLEVEVQIGALPEEAMNHVIYIGLRNILMDAHASITTTEYPNADERKSVADAMVTKKLQALYRGEVRVQSTREGDPVRAEAMRAATKVIIDALKRAGKIKKAADVDAKLVREKAGELIARDGTYMAKAREYIESQKVATPVDLSDLGL